MLDLSKLTHFLILHFENVPNSKMLQTTPEMWLLKDCKIQIENIVEKGEIDHFEQLHLFPQCFPKAFFFNVLNLVYVEERIECIYT